MADYTWVDLDIADAATLADLHGVQWDLRNARDWARDLLVRRVATPPEFNLVEPLSVAVAVMYSRPFVTGVRARLGESDLAIFTSEQRLAHDRLRSYRDKHVAHSVNAFEENYPRANYCVQRVSDEGIISITCGGARVLGLNSNDLNEVIALSEIMLVHVEKCMAAEQKRVLEIVLGMPLAEVLASGHKSFSVPRNDRVHLRRKR